MKHLSIFLIITTLVLPGPHAAAQDRLPQFGHSPISAIIQQMTLDEKVKVVVGKGFSVPGMSMRAVDTTPDKLAAISGHTIPNHRLGIPSISMADGPAGIHRFMMTAQDSAEHLFSTAWPVGTLLASSWDTALVKEVGDAFGQEIRTYGIDFILSPGANIHRNPLGGRNFEYYSEDPLVSGSIAAAMIEGIQSHGVGATIKHFAANNQETDRNSVNEIISERALREIYLRNFEIAITRSRPWAVMSSYNLINGTYTSESHDLLTKVLRDDWKYRGFVMSDWFGGKDAVAQMAAGNDLLMPGNPNQVEAIEDAVRTGRLPMAVLDKNVERILTILARTPTANGDVYPNKADLVAHAKISRAAAAESMVLLKNADKTLPLRQGTATIALFGNHAYDLIAGGTGSGDVNKLYAISLAEGLAGAGYKLEEGLAKQYQDYLADYAAAHPRKPPIEEIMHPTPYAPEYTVDAGGIGAKADVTDAAIVYIGRNAGEGNDRKIADDYALTGTEKEMIARVSAAYHAKHKPVIAVLNIGGVIDVTEFRDEVDAILLAWQPGEEGGNAIADILSGKVDPSGRLATTFPAAYSDEPSARNFPGKEFPEEATTSVVGRSVPAEVVYGEGIYVGYRYFNTFKVKPAYAFGYGLSYTSFSCANLALGGSAPGGSSFNGRLTASVTVTNTGAVAGKEVVQLYLAAPHHSMDKPAEELKAFGKTRLLQPGESQTLVFTLLPRDLASFSTRESAWVAEAGGYEVRIGVSSEDIRLTKSFQLAAPLVVATVSRALVPHVNISELKAPQ